MISTHDPHCKNSSHYATRRQIHLPSLLTECLTSTQQANPIFEFRETSLIEVMEMNAHSTKGVWCSSKNQLWFLPLPLRTSPSSVSPFLTHYLVSPSPVSHPFPFSFLPVLLLPPQPEFEGRRVHVSTNMQRRHLNRHRMFWRITLSDREFSPIC